MIVLSNSVFDRRTQGESDGPMPYSASAAVVPHDDPSMEVRDDDGVGQTGHVRRARAAGLGGAVDRRSPGVGGSHPAILAVVIACLTDEERLLQATAREFAEREVAPGAIERDETERYDRSLFAAMGALGLTAAPLPEVVGGAGFSYLGWSLVMEELGAADMSVAVSLSVHILSQLPVVTWGTPEQQARWLARC